MIRVMRCFLILLTVLWLKIPVHSQKVERVEPPSWFTGMKNPELQLMVYGPGVGEFNVSINYAGVSIRSLEKTSNPNYLFINLLIDEKTLPGEMTLEFTRGKVKQTRLYLLEEHPGRKEKGFSSSDVIYLLMPDRFANGDPSNDNVEGMLEKVSRSKPNGRHGGDLKGIMDHLDYFRDIGVTGIWLNPFLENNQPAYSYHGYSITDFYRVDPRYGTNDEFRELVLKAHSMGLKIVMDMIFNHIGTGHWWMKDLPSDDWVHHFDEFTRTNYRGSVHSDPYASKADIMIMEKGWFDRSMPDLNQVNPMVEKYLVQNSIWWIAYAGIDGIRMDTYPYPDKEMMARWVDRITSEFPGFFIVGEVWFEQEGMTAYWAGSKVNSDGYVSNLPSVTDFPLSLSAQNAFVEPDTWMQGVARVYNTLSQDFLYPDPSNNVIFLDNHDMTRFFTRAGQRPEIYRMALAFILTTRGIPQVYYGTEILMEGDKSQGDGNLRKDFPGGWEGDQVNVFTSRNLTDQQKESLQFTSKLLNWRKGKEVIHKGKLKHFIPDDGLYVYFRYNDRESVMIVINNSETETKVIEKDRYAEAMEGFSMGTEILTGTVINDLNSFGVPPKTAFIIELR